MGFVFDILVCLLAAYVSVSMWMVIIEVLAAMTYRYRCSESIDAQPGQPHKTVILIPAHNEEGEIGRTLEALTRELFPNYSLLCVAHNCSDATASIARSFGADVIEFNNDGAGGKPDALKAGLRWLDASPPDVVVIIDGDCSVAAGAIQALSTQAMRLGRPVMGAYLFSAPEEGHRLAKLSSLAITLKNYIRPLGLHQLGLPCLLNGSGSAFPFRLIREAPHGEGSIAEDYQLSVDLLNLGYPTTFVPEARVDSRLPGRERSAQKQRRRWEHGHLYLSFTTAPRMLLNGLIGLDKHRIALGLELLVAPLTYLSLLLAVCDNCGQAFPRCFTMLFSACFDCNRHCIYRGFTGVWFKFSGFDTTVSALLFVPKYIIWKLPIYRDFFYAQGKALD
ncbi:MAG: glycosyltransferase family 2 protein [Gammaproteobacteria bacterium]|nr:glycosyltransferase family 2 protein [Gammaproteobacteria bacterium]